MRLLGRRVAVSLSCDIPIKVVACINLRDRLLNQALDMAPWGPPEATIEGAALSFIESGASVKVAFCTAEKSESKSLQQYLYPGMLSIFSIHASLVLHQRRKELAGVTMLPE